jgi:hypothetical protein
MFLIKESRSGRDYFIFTHTDPRKEGYRGELIDDVVLDYDVNAVHLWPDGEPAPQPELGRDPTNPKHYTVFKFPDQRRAAGFEFVQQNTPIDLYSWRDYLRMFPALAQALEQEEWSDYLDEIDEATKLRRQQTVDAEPPPGSNRDRIAEWVAKRHLSADGSLRQVVYLPTGAPPDEIRLLEVNERLPRSEDTPEPIDFGIEVAGRPIKLFVADVTGDQLEKLKRDQANLPTGWSLDKALSWGRRR